MKRSEMLVKLVEYHQENFNRYKTGLSILDYYSSILNMIESEGMRPPKRNSEEVARELGEVTSQAFYRSTEIERFNQRLNSWKPENEA